jgi:hypothetical protein
MENEDIVPLLREIRDLHRETIKNQQAALESYSKAMRSQKTTRLVLLIIVMLALAIAVLPSIVGR